MAADVFAFAFAFALAFELALEGMVVLREEDGEEDGEEEDGDAPETLCHICTMIWIPLWRNTDASSNIKPKSARRPCEQHICQRDVGPSRPGRAITTLLAAKGLAERTDGAVSLSRFGCPDRLVKLVGVRGAP